MVLETHSAVITHLEGSAYVRFSLLALSSIFFLVDPFAALPTFLAVTDGQDAAKRVRTARKASLTAFVVLTTFAFIGQYIFRVFGIDHIRIPAGNRANFVGIGARKHTCGHRRIGKSQSAGREKRPATRRSHHQLQRTPSQCILFSCNLLWIDKLPCRRNQRRCL